MNKTTYRIEIQEGCMDEDIKKKVGKIEGKNLEALEESFFDKLPCLKVGFACAILIFMKSLHEIFLVFQCSKAGCGRKLRPTNRIHGANWCVGKQVFIIIECNSKRAICMLHVMDSENARHNV